MSLPVVVILPHVALAVMYGVSLPPSCLLYACPCVSLWRLSLFRSPFYIFSYFQDLPHMFCYVYIGGGLKLGDGGGGSNGYWGSENGTGGV